jgi:amino acid permease
MYFCLCSFSESAGTMDESPHGNLRRSLILLKSIAILAFSTSSFAGQFVLGEATPQPLLETPSGVEVSSQDASTALQWSREEFCRLFPLLCS